MKRANKEATPPGESPKQVDISEKVKLRDKLEGVLKKPRPSSIADRLKNLQGTQESWKGRVEEKDVSQFTVEGKLCATGKLNMFIFFVHNFKANVSEFHRKCFITITCI